MLNLYLKYLYFFLDMKEEKKAYEAWDDILFPEKQNVLLLLLFSTTLRLLGVVWGHLTPFLFSHKSCARTARIFSLTDGSSLDGRREKPTYSSNVFFFFFWVIAFSPLGRSKIS